jgi:hypothetical protein
MKVVKDNSKSLKEEKNQPSREYMLEITLSTVNGVSLKKNQDALQAKG